jgi:hypothetical protein
MDSARPVGLLISREYLALDSATTLLLLRCGKQAYLLVCLMATRFALIFSVGPSSSFFDFSMPFGRMMTLQFQINDDAAFCDCTQTLKAFGTHFCTQNCTYNQ